jgi:Ni,Fe-hydrogenase I cytochrome b subunit
VIRKKKNKMKAYLFYIQEKKRGEIMAMIFTTAYWELRETNKVKIYILRQALPHPEVI